MAIEHIQPNPPNLVHAIHKMADESSLCGRTIRTFDHIKKENGYLAALMTGVGLIVAGIYTASFAYFCLEGTYRSLDEAVIEYQDHQQLSQSFGDAGGWMSLPIFAIFTMSAAFQQFLREGDYRQIKKVCTNWYESLAEKLPLETVYSKVSKTFDSLSQQCLFYKPYFQSILDALDTVDKMDVADLDPHSELALDQRLKGTYQQIQKNWIDERSWKNYFGRIQRGLAVTKNRYGMKSYITNIVTGIAIPILLVLGSVSSVIGEIQLGKKLFIRKEDLVEVGHFGEWPDNILASTFFGCYLNKNLLLRSDIDFLIEEFQRHLDGIKEDKELYNRLADIANEEIKQVHESCFFRQPLQLDFFQHI